MTLFLEIVLSVIVGLLLGNFTTTALYRIPKNIAMYGFSQESSKSPFCSFCSHPLKFYEYLPLIGLISTRGRCNYCGHAIPIAYTILELMGGIISFSCYIVFGFCDIYIILLLFFLLCTMTSMIYIKYNIIPLVLTTSLIVLGLIYRTLVEDTIMNWVLDFSIACIFCMFLLDFLSNKLDISNIVLTILIASAWTYQYGILIYAFMVLLVYIYKILVPKFYSYETKVFPINILVLYIVVLVQNINTYVSIV